MDRREWNKKVAAGAVAALIAPEVIPFKLISAVISPNDGKEICLFRALKPPFEEVIPGTKIIGSQWEQIDWFDMVPGDIISAGPYSDGLLAIWQIAELPFFDKGVKCVGINYVKVHAA